MRRSIIGLGALCAAVLLSAPAMAGGATPADPYPTLGPDDEVVPVVSPGEVIGIACAALTKTAPDNDVRVVLTISAAPTDVPTPGYKKVLATNEELSKGAVHVRIPKLAELSNHTVNVDVYVVNGDGAHNCDAGHMRIAERSQHPKGKKS
jgi:hypothetical protein